MKTKDLFNLLSADIKYKQRTVDSISESLIWGLCVAGILFLFRPFGLSDTYLFHLFLISLGFGIITFIAVAINLITTKRIIYKLASHTWKIQNELFLFCGIAITNSVLNFFYTSVILKEISFSFIGFLRILTYSSSILSFIFIIKNALVLFINYNTEQTALETKVEYYKELKNLNPLKEGDDSSIKLSFDNEELELQLKKTVLIAAWGNYIKILLNSNNKKVELVKRGRIKEVEQQLINVPDFQRCHRSYIVNTTYISKIKGNTKKAIVLLDPFDIALPIAREKIKDFLKSDTK